VVITAPAGRVRATEPAVTANDAEQRAILGRFFAEEDTEARKALAERFAAVAGTCAKRRWNCPLSGSTSAGPSA